MKTFGASPAHSRDRGGGHFDTEEIGHQCGQAAGSLQMSFPYNVTVAAARGGPNLRQELKSDRLLAKRAHRERPCKLGAAFSFATPAARSEP
jgi:hypothetical protein